MALAFSPKLNLDEDISENDDLLLHLDICPSLIVSTDTYEI